ncbi:MULTISPECIES: hydroxyphenylacetyl-CoA thioesterase PaaI [Spongiibacter]|uniref:Hydroxyphenylacetyl-CoA thioesterase PaaI n=1 Tax=Spongiibacter thalassae TaxID=2721624 RepID=A0ABX1GI38_9GAMM|nr:MULTISPECIES: hydroxyphenylacetyl-CoA thioesterase PaaI [Spongiibacter]MAY37920.1 phenylacetic acid degradation protein PaaD [Spongiibacter sp.]MBI57705.1 phenylacetic acid degradation protein PaaD [Spongiibacter sp.]NKI18600.1 hydroxyphenylacetyl-CoA thioesterase PaaI [Spongiibacter thalassae]|tara:strand:+ start:18016 stop:18453 length:438 start_codon:yes stop_codon:yes gene_type:complete
MAVESLTAQELAERCAEVLMQRDDASRHLQMNVESVSPGTATITMSVQDYMIQGHGSCHGGYIFSLADTAFAFACNTYNKVTVAQGCSIEYVKPGKLGDTLRASCCEVSRGRRTGVYDVCVENQEGLIIAVMRGKSYQLGTALLS